MRSPLRHRRLRPTAPAGARPSTAPTTSTPSSTWSGRPTTRTERDTLLAEIRSFVQACERTQSAILPYVQTERAAHDMDRIRIALGEPGASRTSATRTAHCSAPCTPSSSPTRCTPWCSTDRSIPRSMRPLSKCNKPLASSACSTASWRTAHGDLPARFTTMETRRRIRHAFAGRSAQTRCRSTRAAERDRSTARCSTSASRRCSTTARVRGLRSRLPSMMPRRAMAPICSSTRTSTPDGLAMVRTTTAKRHSSRSAVPTVRRWVMWPACARSRTATGPSGPRLGRSIVNGSLPCALWPIEAPPPAALHARGAPPIIVIGATSDPATPFVWAKGLASELDSGVLVSAEIARHTSFKQGIACVDNVVVRYLVDLDAPNGRVRC